MFRQVLKAYNKSTQKCTLKAHEACNNALYKAFNNDQANFQNFSLQQKRNITLSATKISYKASNKAYFKAFNKSNKTGLFNISNQTRGFSQLPELRDRIEAVKKIEKVCNSMKNVAAAKMPKMINVCLRSRKFNETIEPFWKGDLDEKTLKIKDILIVINGSDLGLCGSANSSIGKAVNEFITKKTPKNANLKLGFIGSRCQRFLEKYTKNYAFLINSIHENKEISMDCALNLAKFYILPTKFDKIVFFGNNFVSKNKFKTIMKTFYSREIAFKNSKHLDHYETDIMASYGDLHFNNMYDMAITTALFEIMVEGQAVEQSTRFISMDNATKNIKEMLVEMQTEYNRARQEKITTEICEINSGKMAVMKSQESKD